MTVKISSSSGLPLPRYESEGAAGMDLLADIPSDITLRPLSRVLVPTGLRMEIPFGYECQIRPRSGLALRHGITVLNAPGTIDSDYRGDVGVILVNLSDQPYVIRRGDRIAQAVFARIEKASLRKVASLGETGRGDGGFGSTGK